MAREPMTDKRLAELRTRMRDGYGELCTEVDRLRADTYRWHKWPDEHGGEYPPDETPVLICEKDATGEVFLVRQISKRCGVMGPSFAKAWRLIDRTGLAEVKNGK